MRKATRSMLVALLLSSTLAAETIVGSFWLTAPASADDKDKDKDKKGQAGPPGPPGPRPPFTSGSASRRV